MNPLKWINLLVWNIYTARKKSLAKRLFKLTGKQHHVVPYIAKYGQRLKVVNNDFIKCHNDMARRSKPRMPLIDIVKLLKMSIYSTPSKLK